MRTMFLSILLSVTWLMPALSAVAAGDDAPPAPAAAAPAQATHTLRVMTYNIHIGRGLDGKFDLERIAKVIKACEVDLVALQEVDVRTQRVGGVDQAAELARLTGMEVHFAKAMDVRGGDYGVAVLSRLPIVQRRSHALPGAEGSEPRAAAEVRVRVGGEGGPVVAFVATHIDHQSEPLRLRQLETLSKALADLGDDAPVIIGADLNALPDSRPLAALLASSWQDAAGKDAAPTFPADDPKRRIDYVLARPASKLRGVESRVVEEKVASDHRPVVAVVELKASK